MISFSTLAQYSILGSAIGILDSHCGRDDMVVMVSGGTRVAEVAAAHERSVTVDPDCSSPIVNGERLEDKKGQSVLRGGGGVCVRARECFSGSLKAGIPRFPAPRVNVSKLSHVDRCNDLNRAWLSVEQSVCTTAEALLLLAAIRIPWKAC